MILQVVFGPAVVAVAVVVVVAVAVAVAVAVVVVVSECLVGLPCDLLPLLATWYLYSGISFGRFNISKHVAVILTQVLLLLLLQRQQQLLPLLIATATASEHAVLTITVTLLLTHCICVFIEGTEATVNPKH